MFIRFADEFARGVTTAQLMQACAANGIADLDHSALVKTLDLTGNHEVVKA